MCPSVLPMVFSPGQAHYGFNVTKEMTVERSWGERVYYPACSPGGRLSINFSASAQGTGPSFLYSAIITYCLWVGKQ